MDTSFSQTVVPALDALRHQIVSLSMICLSLIGVKRLPPTTPLADDASASASSSATAITPSPTPTITASPAATQQPKTVVVQQSPTDLLSGRDWTSLPGSSREGATLIVKHTGRSIVEQDGTPGVQNPAIALFGPQLKLAGDFKITAKITTTNAWRLSLYGRPPRIYDEFLFWEPALVVELNAGSLRLAQYDGARNRPTQTTFSVPPTSTAELSVETNAQTIAITLNGNTVGSVPTKSLLSNGKLWFGLDTPTPGGELRLTQFSLTPLQGSTTTIVNTPDTLQLPAKIAESWQELAKKKSSSLKIGAAVALGPLVSDPWYFELATQGWYGVFTTENALKAQFVHPAPDQYAFGEADAIVTVAKRAGIAVHGHTLVFGEANPAWMQQTPKEKREEMMLSHIKTVVSHYKGTIKTWDVINEPLDEDYWDGEVTYRNHLWHQAMGPSYIEKALRAAKASDPQALLFINEWGLEEESDRFTGMLTLIEELLKKDVPIDGLGFQAHVYERGDEISTKTLQSHMEQVVTLGNKYNKKLYVRVSELDAYGHDSSQQASQFSNTLSACIQVPNCIAFSMWGITEKYSSTSGLGRNQTLEIGDGLPFGENYEPLSAVRALQDVLKR